MKVLFLPEVRQYFHELEEVLFEKEYFGFEDSAVQYVRELIFEIENSLPIRTCKKAPSYFNRYGKDMHYASFRKNKATQWYVFFTRYRKRDEMIYLVRYISNNHVIAQYL
ncbi:MAG: hypothetical protein BGO33_07490 [Bacteroidia bacterium 43-41]|nr:MAG: hypothetical protein BGO33_07490 [Bacteroidia bacterium 43-41]